ncbi:MAG: AI-2E family transporter [Gemmatimonadota bacterium]|jgi:predicted PurR-regulated permease PerM
MSTETERERKALLGLSGILLLGSCVLFFPVAKTFLFAATLSVVLVPVMTSLETRLWPQGGSRRQRIALAVGMTFLSLLALFVAAGVIVFVFVRNFEVLKGFGTAVAARLQESTQEWLGAPVDLQARAAESLDQLLGYLQGTFVAAAGVAVQLVIFTSVLYLFLRHGRHLHEAVRDVIPPARLDLFDRFADVTHSSLYGIYVVHVVTAVITVALALPFFHLIGFGDQILFWSLLCGTFQLIPVLGPSLIMVAIGIYAFAQGDNTTGVLVLLIGYPVVAGTPDLVFRPLLLRSGMKVDASILILGFFAGVVSMGMIGFVLGPLILKLLIEAMKMTHEELIGGRGSPAGSG